jgi:hypothetical protein
LDGKYIPGASNILSLFFLQNKIPSYTQFIDTNANTALDNYFSFAQKGSPSSIAHIETIMKDLNLTTVDMFVRGKIGMIV